MAYEKEDIGPTTKERVVEPRKKSSSAPTAFKWWLAESDDELITQVLSTVEFLKKTNHYRIKQATFFSRLYCGKPLTNYFAANSSMDASNQMPIGRPTANVAYSCTDTLVSQISQDRPKPVFLTDGGHYKERKLAKEANAFIQGELYRMKAYDLTSLQVRDACALGDGILKVFAKDGRVCLERTLATELLVDYNDGYYGKPRQLGQLKLVDRETLMSMFPKKADMIGKAVHGNVDSSPRSAETISDQFILAEFWHLPSSEDATDGRHVMVCTAGVISDEPWKQDDFPFVKLGYNPNLVGYFSQGLIEILMPTQMEIYRMLIVASQAIELMGVPRIYIDEMSKIVETSFNNRIGTIIKGRGKAPEFLNAISNPPEIYQWIQWLIQNAYQMSGISSMAAQAKSKPGLDSGEAIREENNLQSARFAAFERRYQDLFPALAYKILECASEIAEETGSYSTVYPGRDGIREIDFKQIQKLKDGYVIQCFEEASLPKDPEGRQARLSEMLAAGEISRQEFRRLSNFPDLEQSDQLANALEERILHALDEIVDNGDRNYASIAPDTYLLDPTNLATTIAVQYINLYSTLQLEESKMNVLRQWLTQVQDLQQAAMPPTPPATPDGAPLTPPTAPPAAPVGPTSGVRV